MAASGGGAMQPLLTVAPERGKVDSGLKVYTVGEAAAILRVKQSWLERQAAARKIPFTMLGGSYHFTAVHLLEIVRLHETAPTMESRECDPGPRPPGRRQPSESPLLMPLRPRPRPGPRRAL